MASESTPQGICSTCRHVARCAWFNNNLREGVQVVWCEEFDDSGIQWGTESGMIRLRIQKPTRPAKGICANCDDARLCKFPSANKGIHFCEEYNSGIQSETKPHRAIDSADGYPNFQVKTIFPGWAL